MPQISIPPSGASLTLKTGVILCLLGSQMGMGSATPCVWETGHSATYDLSSLTKESGAIGNSSYMMNDMDPEHPYYYRFNICGNIGGDDASRTGPCKDQVAAPAYQLNRFNDDVCYRLGGDYLNTLHNVRWYLHDESNPAAGVVLKYLNGDVCGSTQRGRSFDLHFVCRDDRERSMNLPDEEFIIEPNQCEYSMEIKTGYGCPKECERVDNLVCGGQGVCGYDSVLESARCYCDSGYAGSGCQTKSSSSGGGVPGETIALAFVCLLLTAVIGLLAYMWNKLRRLQLDPDAYSQLGNKFNELGQVAQ